MSVSRFQKGLFGLTFNNVAVDVLFTLSNCGAISFLGKLVSHALNQTFISVGKKQIINIIFSRTMTSLWDHFLSHLLAISSSVISVSILLMSSSSSSSSSLFVFISNINFCKRFILVRNKNQSNSMLKVTEIMTNLIRQFWHYHIK